MILIPVMRETFGHARGFQNFRALNEFTTLYPNPSALCGSSGRLEKGENQDVNKTTHALDLSEITLIDRDAVKRRLLRRMHLEPDEMTNFGLALLFFKRPTVFQCIGSCRGWNRNTNFASTLVSESNRNWQCHCSADVHDYTVILGFDSRMGGKSRWLCCTFGRSRAISSKGCGRARSGNLVTG